MVKRAGAEHQERILHFLQQEAVYNTFLLSDILAHGYDKDYQQVYISADDAGECLGVYLRYYNNLILAGDGAERDAADIVALVDRGVNTIMGKAAAVAPVEQRLSCPHSYTRKRLLYLPDGERLVAEIPSRQAGLGDVDAVYAFLMDIPEFRQTYAARDMIVNRIGGDEGVHLYLEREGAIIAHANSAARTDRTCMIGGVAVAPGYRGQGLAKALVSALCRRLLAEGRMPCLFSEVPPERSLFSAIGFQQIGEWGVVGLNCGD